MSGRMPDPFSFPLFYKEGLEEIIKTICYFTIQNLRNITKSSEKI